MAAALAAALVLLALARAGAAAEQPPPAAASFDLRPQAAEFSRAALAEFEAQQAERAKDEPQVYIAPTGDGQEEEEEVQVQGQAEAEQAAPAAAAAAAAANTPAEATAAAAAAGQNAAASPPQPRAMAIARGTTANQQQAGGAGATDPAAAAATPPAPLQRRSPPLNFPTEFPPTPSPAECSKALEDYKAFMAREAAPYEGPEGKSLVYFLHIPRTAGRTFHVCLLRQATPPDRRCPKSYDHLRVDVSLPKCHLLSSHDDFSVVEKLPAETSVVTQLRDPVDRFLSAYEFAAEVAARSVLKVDPFARAATNKTVTEDVWPWSLLVPWFVREAKGRIDGVDAAADASEAALVASGGQWIAIPAPDGKDFYYNAALNASSWDLTDEQKSKLLPRLDPYDNPLIPSLLEFARHPLARELLHDGQALQVLGLTNYSHWEPAPKLRACLFGHKEVARELLGVAERRLARFTHVGSTGRLRESVEAAAAALGAPLLGSAFSPGSDDISSSSLSSNSSSEDGGASAKISTPVTSVAHPRAAELAAASRRAADRVRRAEDRWNAAVARTRQGLLPIGTDPRADPVHAAQPELRQLKGVLNRARAELLAAQGAVVRHRAELRSRGWHPPPLAPGAPAQADGTPLPGDAARAQRVSEERERLRLDGGLGAEFERCARRAQAKNLERRERSLLNLMMPDGRTVSFTKQARAAIPPEVLREIRSLSPLDDALHGLALKALDDRRRALEQGGKLQPMPEGDLEARRAHEAQKPLSRWAKVFPLPAGERAAATGAEL